MFENPFPAEIGFSVIESHEAASLRLHPDEEALLSPRSIEKRKRQFRMGRTAAHRALSQLGIDDLPLLRGSGGEPLWPVGVIGSISHAGDYALAAAAFTSRYPALGLDLELIPEKLEQDVASVISSPEELAWIRADPHQQLLRTIMVFSAKETLLKAFYPICRRSIVFSELSIAPAPEPQRLVARLDTALAPGYGRNAAFGVGFSVTAGYVFTWSVLSPAGRIAE